MGKSSGHEYLGTETEGEVLCHFLRKGGEHSSENASSIPEISLEAFTQKVDRDESLHILDVREIEEYEEAHIPERCISLLAKWKSALTN